MKLGQVLREKQPEVHRKLNKKHSKKKERKAKEHLSFYDIKALMEEGHVYKRGKGGSLKQIK